jgi:ankyrin repeat protein
MKSYPPRPFIPQGNINMQIKKVSYINKVQDDTLIKDFIGKLLSTNLGEIKDFLDRSSIMINNIKDDAGNSPLHIILGIDSQKLTPIERLEICKYLVLKGANIHTYNKQDITPIHLAAQQQFPDILDFFLKYGGNSNILNTSGQSPLHMAIKPVVSFCPQFRASSLIPAPDIKARDINNISKALWQQLNDFFKISDLNKVLDKSDPVNYKIEEKDHFPLLYPLTAIKNIIDKSNDYLKIKSLSTKDQTFFESTADKLFNNIQNELKKSALTSKDKQYKIKELLSRNITDVVGTLNDYYQGAKDSIKFENKNAFKETDLKYFSVNEDTDVIFNQKGSNYKRFFTEAINNLDTQYDREIGELFDSLDNIVDNLNELKEAVSYLHYINISYGGNNNFGYHEYLNSDNIDQFIDKYQLQISKLFIYNLNIGGNKLKYNDKNINIEITSRVNLNDKSIYQIEVDYYKKKIQFIIDNNTIKILETPINNQFNDFELNYTYNITLLNENIIYANTSVIDRFFKENNIDTLKENINNLKLFFQFNSKSEYKYNYYTMYNVLHLLNIQTNEYLSYLLFILNNEVTIQGLSINKYDNLKLLNENIYNTVKKNIKKINEQKIDPININKSLNKIVNILNFHQNLIINYSFIKLLFIYDGEYYDRKNYSINYSEIINNISTLIDDINYKFIVPGLFNQHMQKLPKINYEKATKINKEFFIQAYPIVENMVFYCDISKKVLDNIDNFIIVNENESPDTENINLPIINTEGYLLFVPKNESIFITNTTKKIEFQSLSSSKINNFDNFRYDQQTAIDNNIGIIGVEDIKNPTLIIDLLDPNKLPYDLMNSYFGLISDKSLLSYLEIVSNLKRVFISMVLDTRTLPIYQYPPKSINNIPGPVQTTPPNKRIGILFGHNGLESKKSLYEYVEANVEKMLGSQFDKSKEQVTIMTNRLIAEGIDEIVSKNIESYYNSEAIKLQKTILDKSLPGLDTQLDMPVLSDMQFKVDFTGLNSKMIELISNTDYYNSNKQLFDIDMILMEDHFDKIDINEYTFNIPQTNNKDKTKEIYFKQDYLKSDESIFKKEYTLCILNNTEIIDTLIKNGANINQQDVWGKTPLFYAIETKNYSLLNYLLKNYSNIFIKSLQMDNAIKFTIIQEIYHQNILLDENTFTYADNYKLNMINIFETNDELKKNMPKTIEIINYVPIYVINNIWFNLFKAGDKKELKELFYKYFNTEDDNYNLDNKSNNFLLNHDDIKDELDKEITLFNSDKAFGFESILKKMEINDDKYGTILQKTDNSKIKELQSKNSAKLQSFKSKIQKSVAPLFSKIAKLVDSSKDTIIEQFDEIKLFESVASSYELAHYIYARILKKYNSLKPFHRGENIHLYISSIYSKLLLKLNKYIAEINVKQLHSYNEVNKLTDFLNDIKCIENNLKFICDYLDQRYLENATIENNMVLADVCNSICYTTIITVQNNFLLAIKKMVILYIIRTLGVESFDKYKGILDLLTNDEGPLNYRINKNKRDNITVENVKTILGVKDLSDNENIDYTGFDNYVADIRQILVSNSILPIPNDSIFMKNYDNYIIPYYRLLFRTSIDHQKKLLTNYIKYIINQYNGVKVIRLILENLLLDKKKE